MPIIGSSFDKISVERKGKLSREEEIKNHVNVKSLEATKMSIGPTEKDALKIFFEFTVNYGKAGKIELLGSVLYLDSEENIKEILNTWKKTQKMSPEFGAQVYNFIIHKCSLKALQLESDIGFPLHIILPEVKVKK